MKTYWIVRSGLKRAPTFVAFLGGVWCFAPLREEAFEFPSIESARRARDRSPFAKCKIVRVGPKPMTEAQSGAARYERDKIIAWLERLGEKRKVQYPFHLAHAIRRGEHHERTS